MLLILGGAPDPDSCVDVGAASVDLRMSGRLKLVASCY